MGVREVGCGGFGDFVCSLDYGCDGGVTFRCACGGMEVSGAFGRFCRSVVKISSCFVGGGVAEGGVKLLKGGSCG